jgi:hypothetical protein
MYVSVDPSYKRIYINTLESYGHVGSKPIRSAISILSTASVWHGPDVDRGNFWRGWEFKSKEQLDEVVQKLIEIGYQETKKRPW